MIAKSRSRHQVSTGSIISYGSVPARKIVPSCRPAPRGRTRNTTSCPLFSPPSTLVKSSGLLTGTLLISSTMSPRFKPMSSANDPGLYFLHCYALARWNIQPVGQFRRYGAHRCSSLLSFGVSSASDCSSSPSRDAKSFERSRNRHARFVLLGIAHVPDLCFRSRLAARNFSDQFVARFCFLAIDRDDRVAYL